MEKSYPKQFFTRLVVLAGIAVLVVVLSYIIGSSTTFTAILSSLLLLLMAFILLFYWVIVVGDLFKHTLDKEKEKFNFLYLTNMFFITIILVFYLVFYFQLLGGAFIELLF